MSEAALPLTVGSGRELLAEALANLNARRQRSILALLGVVIGTAAVVAMLTIGHNAEREALRQFALMGVDLLVIQEDQAGGRSTANLSGEIVEQLPARHAEITAAAPLVVGADEVGAGARRTFAGVLAVTPAAFELAGLTAQQGRLFTIADETAPVAVIGAELAESLSAPGRPMGPGGKLRVGDYVFDVVGVMAPAPQSNLIPVVFDTTVIVPMGSARRALEQPQVNAAIARMRPGVDDAALAQRVGEDLMLRTRGAPVQVQSARQLVEALKKQKAVHTRLLAAIGGISLLVGGVGVMNVMLMGVMERRAEIGIRMAVGARPRDIQLMFLIEALALALAGGVAGALLGVVAALLFSIASGWSFSPALYALPLGAGVAGAIGLVAGVYPAVKAAGLDPVAALRTE